MVTREDLQNYIDTSIFEDRTVDIPYSLEDVDALLEQEFDRDDSDPLGKVWGTLAEGDWQLQCEIGGK